jgi:hypothetical protein
MHQYTPRPWPVWKLITQFVVWHFLSKINCYLQNAIIAAFQFVRREFWCGFIVQTEKINNGCNYLCEDELVPPRYNGYSLRAELF